MLNKLALLTALFYLAPFSIVYAQENRPMPLGRLHQEAMTWAHLRTLDGGLEVFSKIAKDQKGFPIRTGSLLSDGSEIILIPLTQSAEAKKTRGHIDAQLQLDIMLGEPGPLNESDLTVGAEFGTAFIIGYLKDTKEEGRHLLGIQAGNQFSLIDESNFWGVGIVIQRQFLHDDEEDSALPVQADIQALWSSAEGQGYQIGVRVGFVNVAFRRINGLRTGENANASYSQFRIGVSYRLPVLTW